VEPISKLAALKTAVRQLLPVPPGKVRVFRGQTAKYPTITPAVYRRHIPSNGVWVNYSRCLLDDIKNDHALRHPADEELRVQALWLEAVAQHYGSGSSYLDVTHDMECAAWFALHEGKPVGESSLGAAKSVMSDFTADAHWFAYSRTSNPGYLYAFDVDVWDQISITPSDLALVDLSNAPEPFRTPRMLAQRGCVIHAEASKKHDLLGRAVEGTPIEIRWPMTGSEIIQRTVEQMFPGPSIDQWYRRFLMAPLSPVISDSKLMLKRLLPVTLYVGETDAYNSALTDAEWAIDPPLLHMLLQNLPITTAPEIAAIRTATPVVLEGAYRYITPRVDSTLWNHELLISDLCDSVSTYSVSGSKQSEVWAWEKVGEVPLDNVLFQFSPLEEVFWERTLGNREPRRLTRGLWLRRTKESCVAALVVQDYPSPNLEVQHPVELRYDGSKRRIMYKPIGENAEWASLSSARALAKVIFIALHLQRAMNPLLKAEAWPLKWICPEPQDGSHNNDYFAMICNDVARLVQIKGAPGIGDWYALRNWRNDPFTTVKDPGPYLRFNTSLPFCELPASLFRAGVAAKKTESEQLLRQE